MSYTDALRLKTYANQIKEGYLNQEGSPSELAVKVLKGAVLTPDEIKYVCSTANRMIKLHYFSFSDPEKRKT